MRCRLFLLLFVSFFHGTLFAQPWDDWVREVNWDGVSHWSRYMLTYPAFQGPNSLPVPRIANGRPDSNFSVSLTGNLHYSKGDKTQNIAVYANYPIVKDVISFDAAWVPYERFSLSHEVIRKRHINPEFYREKEAMGELHLNTNFQLLKKWRKHIDLALRLGYRFPCGSSFGAARYTDGPGYHFDVSFGKPFRNSPLKWIGMVGFYTWQIISDKHRQDDAFLFGSGLEWNARNTRIQVYGAGYLGYLEGSGDKPVVVRANMERRFGRMSAVLGFQQGINDFEYTSVEFGAKYFLKKY